MVGLHSRSSDDCLDKGDWAIRGHFGLAEPYLRDFLYGSEGSYSAETGGAVA
jgi:hypothetical protein